MAITLAHVVEEFKADVGAALAPHYIEKLCRDLGHRHRDRLLGPVATIHAFLAQILHGNVACSAVPHLVGQTFSAGAYCDARTRLPLELFEGLFDRVSDGLYAERRTTGLWLGHRTWHLDGSSFSMADRPELQATFGQPGGQKIGCGFPVAHLLALFHAGTGFLQRVIVSPMRTHDLAHAEQMLPELDSKDILIADRGFASFVHLNLISLRKSHAVLRCHQKQIVNFRVGRRHKISAKDPAGLPTSRWIKRLGKHDQLVEYIKPKTKPSWMCDDAFTNLSETVVVRELRYKITLDGCRTKVVTLVTTLLDPVVYPAREIAELYAQRWQIETNLRHLKTTMKMEVLHCQSVAGIKKEVAMFALAYNLVRLVMLRAAARQKVVLSRISFIDALRWLRTAKPGEPMPKLIVNPHRPGRVEPRVVKRRPKGYALLTKPRHVLRKALLGKKVTP